MLSKGPLSQQAPSLRFALLASHSREDEQEGAAIKASILNKCTYARLGWSPQGEEGEGYIAVPPYGAT
eukprot:scaffold166785_cov17-Tisochrysis_lutea.AAC.1